MKVDLSERVADDKQMQNSLLSNLVNSVHSLYNKLRSAYEKHNPGATVESLPSNDGWDYLKTKVNGEVMPDTVQILLKRYQSDPMKAFDRLLWRIEIDTENIEDLMSHVQGRKDQTFREKLKSLFPKFF